jgi:hypothetical protein
MSLHKATYYVLSTIVSNNGIKKKLKTLFSINHNCIKQMVRKRKMRLILLKCFKGEFSGYLLISSV